MNNEGLGNGENLLLSSIISILSSSSEPLSQSQIRRCLSDKGYTRSQINRTLYTNQEMFIQVKGDSSAPLWRLRSKLTDEKREQSEIIDTIVYIDLDQIHDIHRKLSGVPSVVVRAFCGKAYNGDKPKSTIIANSGMRHEADILLLKDLILNWNKWPNITHIVCSKDSIFTSIRSALGENVHWVCSWDEVKMLL